MRAVNLLPPTERRRPGFSGARKPLAIAERYILSDVRKRGEDAA